MNVNFIEMSEKEKDIEGLRRLHQIAKSFIAMFEENAALKDENERLKEENKLPVNLVKHVGIVAGETVTNAAEAFAAWNRK